LGDLVWRIYAVTFDGVTGETATKVTAAKIAKVISGKENSYEKQGENNAHFFRRIMYTPLYVILKFVHINLYINFGCFSLNTP